MQGAFSLLWRARRQEKITDCQAACKAVASPTSCLTIHPASWHSPRELHRLQGSWRSCFSPDLCLQIAPPSFFPQHSVRECRKQEGSNTSPRLSLYSRDKHREAADGKQMPQVLQISCLQPFPQSCSWTFGGSERASPRCLADCSVHQLHNSCKGPACAHPPASPRSIPTGQVNADP